MAPGSNEKRKLTRGRKGSPKLSITEWTIGQATTLGHVSVSFVAFRDSDDVTPRPVTRCFLLRHEKLAQLIDELKEALDDSAATERLAEQQDAASVALTAESESASMYADTEDTEASSNHLSLGVYGLVGN